MATTITAGNATNGAAISSDNTGILELKSGTGSGTTAVTIGTNQAVTFAGAVTSSGNQTVTGNLTVDGNTTLGNANTDTILMTAAPSIGGAGLGMGFGFRNRIINGAMVIDQRNAGASVTPTDEQFLVDRWGARLSQSSKFTAQQNQGSVTPPTGFRNYLGFTSSSAYSSLSTDYFFTYQGIEGFNTFDLAFGTASASSITISFWVRSSLTGTFSGALSNGAANRFYPFTFTISAANTWEYKTVTVAGDTSGTWATNNTTGLQIKFNLGSGSTRLATAGAWTGSIVDGATGSVSLVGTNGATFYITGVQLEKGSTATSFDVRPYGTELMLCQRYFEKSYNDGTAIGAVTVVGVVGQSGLQGVTSTTEAGIYVTFKVTKRATPTIAVWDGNGNSNKVDRIQAGVTNNYNSTFSGTSNLGGNGFVGYSASGATCTSIQFHYTASSEL